MFPRLPALRHLLYAGGLVFGMLSAQAAHSQQSTGWNVSCADDQLCELKTEILSNELVAARLSLVRIRDIYILQYLIPLGVDSTQTIRVAVDEEPSLAIPITSCSARGCLGSVTITSPFIQSMKRGAQLNVFFVSALNQDTFAITFDLTGFTAGYSELVAR